MNFKIITEYMRQIIRNQEDKFTIDIDSLSYHHIMWMLGEIDDMPPEKAEMANRWIGWAQCAIVAAGCCTLEDMKEINVLALNA